jgi:cholesterol transport system auxiliary component
MFIICAALVSGCGALRTAPSPDTVLYSLYGVPTAMTAVAPANGLTLVINPTHAAAGFDSRRIIYTREAHRIEHFAHSEWVDTPARMLAPLIVAAAADSGAFLAVVLTPSAAVGDLRLDTEIVSLQQEFGGTGSQVRFSLRAWLVDSGSRKVLASREFDALVRAGSDDPPGGVSAANEAVRRVLAELAAFCTEAARKLPAATGNGTSAALSRQ